MKRSDRSCSIDLGEQSHSRSAHVTARLASMCRRGAIVSTTVPVLAVLGMSIAASTVDAAQDEGSFEVVEMSDLRTHTVDIKGAFSNENGEEGPAGASVFALPCPHQRYLFVAHAEMLPAGPSRTYKAQLAMGAARLPRGVACGRPLPASLGTSRFSMVALEVGSKHPSFRITGERLPNGNLNAAIGEFESSLCNGRYHFTATFVVGSRRLVFTYPFVLTNEVLRPKPIKCPHH